MLWNKQKGLLISGKLQLKVSCTKNQSQETKGVLAEVCGQPKSTE